MEKRSMQHTIRDDKTLEAWRQTLKKDGYHLILDSYTFEVWTKDQFTVNLKKKWNDNIEG
ncbi:MAG: hypothetical protein PUE58_01845 [Lachnospiraceae bacterium]|nr:hypothetical protein [Lachnospiraceae bacterium]